MRKKGEIMARVMNNIENIKLPPNVEREIGLGKGWQKNISPKSVNAIINKASRFKEALRKLSKN